VDRFVVPSVKMRSRERLLEKYPAYMISSALRAFAYSRITFRQSFGARVLAKGSS